MKKQYSSDMVFLPVVQLTHAELLELAEILCGDAQDFHYIATWKSRDIAEGDDINDLNEIEDFEGLDTLRLAFLYDEGDLASIYIEGDATSIKWQGSEGAERARRFQYRWLRLQGVPRFSASRVERLRVAVQYLPAVAVAGVVVQVPAGLLLSRYQQLAAVVLAVAIASIAFNWAATRHESIFRAVRARYQPFVEERRTSPWRDIKFVAPLVVAVLATIGTLLSAYADMAT